MKKDSLNVNLCISILMTAFMIYSVIIFAFVEEMNSFFWCSFALTTVILIFQIVMNEYTSIKSIEVRDAVFKLPIISIGIIFMSIQIIYAIVFSFINIEDYSVLFVIQFLTFALYCALVIASLLVSLKKTGKEVTATSYINYIATSIKNLETNAVDLNSKVLLHQLYIKILNSSSLSTNEAIEIELQIQNKVVNFNKIINTCDSATLRNEIKELNQLFEERNRICKIANQ